MFGIVDAGEITITLSPVISNNEIAKRIVGPESHTIKIYISGGKNGSSLKTESLPSWIRVDSSNSYFYKATISLNSGTSARKGSIIIFKGTKKYQLDVTQNAFQVKNTSGTVISALSYEVAGGTKNIYTNYDCTPPAIVPDWLTVTKSGSGNGYTIKAAPNLNGSTREFTLTFTKSLSKAVKVNRTVKISQSANSLTGVSYSRTVKDVGSSFTFTVSTGYGTVKAQLANNYTWLHVSRNGNTITVSYDPNVMLYERSGEVNITIGDIKKSFTVTQKALQFDNALQVNIINDNWSKDPNSKDPNSPDPNSPRIKYLGKFFDGLYNGAGNTSNSVGTRYVVGRAKTITNFSWNNPSFAYGYRENSDDPARNFAKNSLYFGLPYQQTDKNGNKESVYFHYSDVETIDQFRNKVNDSEFGFGNLRKGKNGSGKDCDSLGPKCGIDCSSFVSFCIGASEQQSSASLKDSAKTQITNLTTTMNIQPGDILWRDGHVLLVASVVKNDSSIQGLVLLESRGRTTASGRNIHVFYNSADALSKMFGYMSVSECRAMLKYLVLNNSETYKNVGTVSDFIKSFNEKHTLLKTSSLDITLEYTKAFY